MFGHKGTKHLGEAKHDFLHSITIDQVKMRSIKYVFVVGEGASNAVAPVFHEGSARRACDLPSFNFDSDLFKGKITVDEFIVIDTRDKNKFGKSINNDIDFLTNSELMPLLLLILM